MKATWRFGGAMVAVAFAWIAIGEATAFTRTVSAESRAVSSAASEAADPNAPPIARKGRRPKRQPTPPPSDAGVGDIGGGPQEAAEPPPVCGPGVLCAADVEAVARAAAKSIADQRMTVAVVDRFGRVLGIFHKPSATGADDELAVGVARTAAFFSNEQAPLSSRTVRFVSGIHFPPAVENTSNAALYGIENSNRGCDLGAPAGSILPEGRSVAGIAGNLACNAFDVSGCGLGIVTGKVDAMDSDEAAVNPGGVPIYRPAPPGGKPTLLGGVGVAGVDFDQAEFAAFQGARASGLLPVPTFPLPAPGNVFIDGVRLPFVDNVSQPAGSSAGSETGIFVRGPSTGRPAPEGYLFPIRAGSLLSVSEVLGLVEQSSAAATATRAQIRLPLGQRTRMVISVADVDGTLLALFRMPDSTIFSIDVAATKARNVVYFSSSPNAPADLPGVPAGTAVTNRTISFGAQPRFPPGISGTSPGPFFDLFARDLLHPCSQGQQAPNVNQSGIVFFPGSIPLYRGGRLVGGLGISGDGVEQDDYVSFQGAEGFRPAESTWANRVFIRGVRLPFLKFPRNPEG